MRCNFHQSVRDRNVGEDCGEPVGVRLGVATVGKIGRHEAGMLWVMVQIALTDVRCKLDLTALVEAFADSVLEVSAGRGKN